MPLGGQKSKKTIKFSYSIFACVNITPLAIHCGFLLLQGERQRVKRQTFRAQEAAPRAHQEWGCQLCTKKDEDPETPVGCPVWTRAEIGEICLAVQGPQGWPAITGSREKGLGQSLPQIPGEDPALQVPDLHLLAFRAVGGLYFVVLCYPVTAVLCGGSPSESSYARPYSPIH